ncbi:MAG TPA: Hsp70 family protein [Aggregatilineaceae bacterium]|nr:Hsp70 family protein [Aggregatilineaceae bacterium]
MIVGMDFGTTNSGMSVYDGEQLHLLPLDPANNNPHVVRTALYITNQKRVYLGRGAIEAYYAQNLNRKVKFEPVWVGEVVMTYAELPEFVRDVYIDKDVLSPGRLFLSFKTSLSASNYFGTTVGADFYFIEDIAGLYLYITKKRAEAWLGQEVKRIVLGRPVRFSFDTQADALAQQRLLNAAFRAGYEEVYFQYEPIAAAYFYETALDHEQNVLVFDFGGGTLDMSIVRLGNPARREILATGGVPIAGDIFDQKLVRAKLPSHFGENSQYKDEYGSTHPMPSQYYEAFANWQSILELNTPYHLKTLEHIAQGSTERRRIRALINLISSSYGLKLFDEVEAIKRELSRSLNALIRLEGPGFQITQLVTRVEFERMIQQERDAIETMLDEVVQRSGLRYDQIDAVIRTGGSSQIPVFIQMLQNRFGAEKVKSIDTFSSVTSGLGILAHQIESGAMLGPAFQREGWNYGGHLRVPDKKKGVPAVDLTLIQRLVDLQEKGQEARVTPESGLVALTLQQEITTLLQDIEEGPLDFLAADDYLPGSLVAANADQKLLLMTSDYRFLLKTPQELAEMQAMGLRLVQTDSLHVDAFGEEFISGILPLDTLQEAKNLILFSTSGQAKLMRADTILPSLDQPTPFRVERLPGYPAALVGVDDGGTILVSSMAGNLLRITPEMVANRAGGKFVKVSSEDRVSSAVYLPEPIDLVLINDKGRAKMMRSNTIPLSMQLAAGQKMIAGKLRGLVVTRREANWMAVTSQRVVPLDLPQSDEVVPALRLKKGEEVLGLFDACRVTALATQR